MSNDASLTIYKTVARSFLGNVGIIYNKSYNESYSKKDENVQHRACLAITNVI